MNPLTIMYWGRVALGAVAAVLCVLLGLRSLLLGLALSLFLYLFSDLLYSWRFAYTVEKQSKFFSTGIGAYFITWLVLWTLLHTLRSMYGLF